MLKLQISNKKIFFDIEKNNKYWNRAFLIKRASNRSFIRFFIEYKRFPLFYSKKLTYFLCLDINHSIHAWIDRKIKDWQIIDNDDKDHSDC